MDKKILIFLKKFINRYPKIKNSIKKLLSYFPFFENRLKLTLLSIPLRIVIDLQGAQTESRLNDIGKHTIAIAKAIIKNKDSEDDVILALNGLFPDTIEPIRAEFHDLLPQENIRVWYAPEPVKEIESGNEYRRDVAERIREAFLYSLQPDIILVASFFEGFVDDAVTSIDRFDDKIPTAVIVYDLAPYRNPKIYLDANPAYKEYYLRKIEYLKKAKLYLVISEYTSKDIIKALKFGKNNVVNIMAAAEADLGRAETSEDERDLSAKIALNVLRQAVKQSQIRRSTSKKKLAYLSPLPPEQSGISYYSSELLPELARFYDIEVIVNQKEVPDDYIRNNLAIRDVDYFKDNFYNYDRVLYHFGNSPFHSHMFDLVENYPGVVVLHDFFLSSVISYLEGNSIKPNFWSKEILYSHGYRALQERFNSENIAEVIYKYPCNLRVLENALGVIVHSNYSKQLSKNFYGESIGKSWPIIPQLIDFKIEKNQSLAREKLSFGDDEFIICTFGILGPTKLNHRLLNAWCKSKLSKDPNCHLIFVGESYGGDYGKNLLEKINKCSFNCRIKITGWVDSEEFKYYLSSADIAVQLRTLSRGETSRSVLDCMNYGLATIVNANGSMQELPKDAVYMLLDDFEDDELVKALEDLWKDREKRATLGKRARDEILKNHNPKLCAERYYKAIEGYYTKEPFYLKKLIDSIASIRSEVNKSDVDILNIDKSIKMSFPKKSAKRKIFLDITVTAQDDFKTGIQRAVRSILINLIKDTPLGVDIEPVYLSKGGNEWNYKYARNYVFNALGCQQNIFRDEIVNLNSNDILIGIDLTGSILLEAQQSRFYKDCINNGVKIYFVVYDLLPISFPHYFPPGAVSVHEIWARSICSFDGAICILRSVADELKDWIERNDIIRLHSFKIGYFHLGSDLENSIHTKGLPDNVSDALSKISSKNSFLMVGTLEPRKAHLQTLCAFEILWGKKLDLNLVIAGKEGWMVDGLLQKIKSHPELGKRLFWLQSISDEYLERVYESSSCLIMASEGEGFGLPLIEAARHKIPIIARDIPVFREIAQEYAYYFKNSLEPEVISKVIEDWLNLYKDGKHPKSNNMPHISWKESAERLLDVVLEEKFDYIILPK